MRLFYPMNRITRNTLARFKTFNFWTTKFMRNICANLAIRAGKFSGISFVRNGFGRKRFVVGLNLPSRPSAILFTIMEFIINAVNRSVFLTKLFYMSKISSIHIFSKIFEIPPKVFNSFASIVFIRFVFRILASLFYLTPYGVKSAFMKPVFGRRFTQGIGSFTTTRFSVPIFKIISDYKGGISTITKTFPYGIMSPDVREFKHSKFTEFLTRNINRFPHAINIAKSRGKVNVSCGDNLKYQNA